MTDVPIRRPARTFLRLAPLALIVAIGATAATAQGTEEQPIDLVLGGIHIRLMLPAGTSAIDTGTDNRAVFDASRGGRLERRMELTTASGHTPTVGAHLRRYPGGAEIHYTIDDDTGGGSGGPVAELTGTVLVGGHVFALICTDQNEFAREPEWCLPHVGRMVVTTPNR